MKEACAIFKTAAAVAVEDVEAIFSVVLRRKREKTRTRVFKFMFVTMLSRPTNSLREEADQRQLTGYPYRRLDVS